MNSLCPSFLRTWHDMCHDGDQQQCVHPSHTHVWCTTPAAGTVAAHAASRLLQLASAGRHQLTHLTSDQQQLQQAVAARNDGLLHQHPQGPATVMQTARTPGRRRGCSGHVQLTAATVLRAVRQHSGAGQLPWPPPAAAAAVTARAAAAGAGASTGAGRKVNVAQARDDNTQAGTVTKPGPGPSAETGSGRSGISSSMIITSDAAGAGVTAGTGAAMPGTATGATAGTTGTGMAAGSTGVAAAGGRHVKSSSIATGITGAAAETGAGTGSADRVTAAGAGAGADAGLAAAEAAAGAKAQAGALTFTTTTSSSSSIAAVNAAGVA
jgi:hypothetical protein